jgi:hypothetical protein
LVERRGNIVSKEEIMGTGWPRTVVAEGNLFVQTAALRQILGAAQPGQSCTQTEIGRVIDLSRRCLGSRPLLETVSEVPAILANLVSNSAAIPSHSLYRAEMRPPAGGRTPAVDHQGMVLRAAQCAARQWPLPI